MDQVAKFRFCILCPSPTQPGTWILNKKFHNGPFRSRAPRLEKAFSVADRMRRWKSAGNLALWLICQGSKHWFVICSSEVHPLTSGNSDSSDLRPLATQSPHCTYLSNSQWCEPSKQSCAPPRITHPNRDVTSQTDAKLKSGGHPHCLIWTAPNGIKLCEVRGVFLLTEELRIWCVARYLELP